MRIAPLFALLLLALAACAPPAPTAVVPATVLGCVTGGDAVVCGPPGDSAGKCASAGGEWRPVCKSQRPMCVVTYKGAGTICSDSSQCEGRCIGDRDETPSGQQMAGRCEANNDPCGCTTEVIGGVPRTICVD